MFQLLIRVVDRICSFVGGPAADWTDPQWSTVLLSPNPIQRQIDGWSCGLFCLLAVEKFMKRVSFESDGNNVKEAIRTDALRRLLRLPYVLFDSRCVKLS